MHAGSLTPFRQEVRPYSAGSLTLDMKLMVLKRRQLVCLHLHMSASPWTLNRTTFKYIACLSAGGEASAVEHVDRQVAAAEQ